MLYRAFPLPQFSFPNHSDQAIPDNNMHPRGNACCTPSAGEYLNLNLKQQYYSGQAFL